MRHRQQKGPRPHFLILLNRQATNFSEDTVQCLTETIRSEDGLYTIEEPRSAGELVRMTEVICGVRRSHRRLPSYMTRRGKVTALVAAGGDGTANKVAGVALAAGLPMGVLPMGRYNDIARSLDPSLDIDRISTAIAKRKYRQIDTIHVDGNLVVGSLSMGLLAQLREELTDRNGPRFAFRWKSLGTRVAEAVKLRRLILKLDAFRFEIRPTVLNINLLRYTMGLDISPASILDDQQAEVIFDVECDDRDLGNYVRQVYKGKYLYGNEVRLFRGSVIHLHSVRQQQVLIDGEKVHLSTNEVEMQVSNQSLKIFC
ncbi:MAG: hypothetical protein KOO62_00600 [candidate division Zixibacteria bacterium]|nr:hypothetical protein [candidate division Zixibacteria bacterium]